ncbi:MAG: hypothetical protein MZW92_11935 [Comamonadaceae bacterium]|nr:hypothetical protein [Comamonadaceae bacterium]
MAAILGYGYTQQWFKFAKIGTGSSATETLSSAGGPAAVANAQEAVVKARQAFASGDVQGAINGYQQVLAANPNDFGTMGELANVYYMTGWIPHATQMYYETASKAIEQNRPDVAEALLPVIIRGNPMLASQLQDRHVRPRSAAVGAELQRRDSAANPAGLAVRPVQGSRMPGANGSSPRAFSFRRPSQASAAPSLRRPCPRSANS